MAKVIYTAEATVTGGRVEGHGRTSDGALEVDIRLPAEVGGPGGGTNPEQLFAVGYASCFESALQTVARRAKVEADDVSVTPRSSSSPTPSAASTWPLRSTSRCRASTTVQRPSTSSSRRTRCARTRTRRGGTSKCG